MRMPALDPDRIAESECGLQNGRAPKRNRIWNRGAGGLEIECSAKVWTLSQAQIRTMSKEIRQESTGDQSPNVVSEGPVTISYNTRKTAIGAAALVAVLAVVVILLILYYKRDEEEQQRAIVAAIEKRVVEAVRNNREVEELVEGGQLETLVYRQVELLAEMKSQIEGFRYEVDVEALLNEVRLEEAEKWVKESYRTIEYDPEKAPRAAAEAFVLGGIESLRFEYDLARKYFREAIDLNPENSLYHRQLGSLELLHGKGRADYAAARIEFEKALQIRFCELGEPDSQAVPTLIDTCDLEVAPTLRDACDAEIMSTPNRAPDSEVAIVLNELGKAWYKYPHFIKANCYYERALEIRRETGGDRDVGVAAVLNNIGIVLDRLRRNTDAREKFDEALDIYELNENRDWAYANTLHNRGASWFDSEKLGNARKDFERAFDVRKEVLGTKHPDTASSLYSLGNVAMELEDKAAALEYYREAHGILEDTLGPDHPYTLVVEAQMCRAVSPEPDQC